jgi:modification methylase
MLTSHEVFFGSSTALPHFADESVDLVLTSPPYPMIEMWDSSFAAQDPSIEGALQKGNGDVAFEKMHCLLDLVWRQCYRILKPGSFACINIGDAVRTVDGSFSLYPNHARIIQSCTGTGFRMLPAILWRKQTNAPNKFMGSGMLPAGAYVTLEHEYILVFRKGGKRLFSNTDKEQRRRSAFFWEERNSWFSDIWDFKGSRQAMADSRLRARSGSFPFELAFRLVNMYSLQEDTVFDPFLGTGTSMAAALASGRNSRGTEIEAQLQPLIEETLAGAPKMGRARQQQRLADHKIFIQEYSSKKGSKPKHFNHSHNVPVITGQEKELQLPFPDALVLQSSDPLCFRAEYSTFQ